MASAAARTSLSVTRFAKWFQLFQPMAGVAAILVCAVAAMGRATRARASRVLRMGLLLQGDFRGCFVTAYTIVSSGIHVKPQGGRHGASRIIGLATLASSAYSRRF